MPRHLLPFLLLAAATPAAAQRVGDEARLVFTMSTGYATGPSLWTIPNQPVFDGDGADIFALGRDLRDTWTIGLGGTLYQRPGLGLGLDFLLVNLGYRDSCTLAFTSGADRTRETCASIDGATRNAMASEVTGSLVLRAGAREPISPFLRVNAGFMWQTLNTTQLSGFYRNPSLDEIVEFPIYSGSSETRFSPLAAVGAGVTVPIARAYHLRLEGRATTYNLQTVAGPNPRDGQVPRRGSRWIVQYSLSAGIDLVLERRRGRRY